MKDLVRERALVGSRGVTLCTCLVSRVGGVSLLATSIFLVGCSLPKPVGPDYVAPNPELPSFYKFEPRKNGKVAAKRDRWWSIFKDAKLNEIMGQVRSSNQEIRAAYARTNQARSNILFAKSENLPGVSASPSAQRIGQSDGVNFSGSTSNDFSVPFSASWEVDLFGRIRRTIESSTADLQSSQEELNDLRLSLEADAAVRYFNLRALDREIEVVESEIVSREESLDVAEDRFNLGAVSQLDVSRVKAELAANRADLASLKRERITEEAAIAVLAGKPATSFSIGKSPLRGSAPVIPRAIPSELLRARPDIRSAERQLASANAQIGVAIAAYYPSLSLTGVAGFEAVELNRLLKRSGTIWSYGPEIFVPIFSAGRNKSRVLLSQAQYEEVLANYQQAIFTALSEVETHLASTRQLQIQSTAQNEAVAASLEARATAKDQYDGGITDYLSLLDAQRTALSAERAQAILSGVEYVNAVNLIRALGGSW